ncbi:MAG: hypothetical protein ABMA00_07995 [Gemmatimonas sp.]
MRLLAGIVIGIGIVLALAPFVIRLARHWQRETAGVAAGSLVDGGAGAGGHVAQLRHEQQHEFGGDDNGGGGDSGGSDGGGDD